MSEFPVPAPETPLILHDLESGVAHVAWMHKETGRVYSLESCGDGLRALPRDIRDTEDIKVFCGRCASELIHDEG